MPVPLDPTRPKTSPGLGYGNLWSLKALGPYLWVTSYVRPFGKLMILIASNGHLLTHIPHPMHKDSEIKHITDVGSTSIHILPVLLTGQVFLHSYLHFLGLHLSGFMIAILNFSSPCFSTIFNIKV